MYTSVYRRTYHVCTRSLGPGGLHGSRTQFLVDLHVGVDLDVLVNGQLGKEKNRKPRGKKRQKEAHHVPRPRRLGPPARQHPGACDVRHCCGRACCLEQKKKKKEKRGQRKKGCGWGRKREGREKRLRREKKKKRKLVGRSREWEGCKFERRRKLEEEEAGDGEINRAAGWGQRQADSS